MREMPVNDVATKNGHLRPDGRLERDLYLLEVKAPAESTGPWDLYKVDATISGRQSISSSRSGRMSADRRSLRTGHGFLSVSRARGLRPSRRICRGGFALER